VATAKTIGPGEIQAAIARLADGISARHRGHASLLLLGVANGGIELARRLAHRLGETAPRLRVQSGVVDISFHRDDIGRHPIPKEFAPTQIPTDVHGATIILVDDVLFSGRTVKAALDELFDHGRPTKVELAVLVDRGGRRLPMAADYMGLHIEARDDEKIIVSLDSKKTSADVVKIVRQIRKPQSAI
jgi:pyrimidine operon attenuation protein/uracil phosphoribosyltransferase